MEDSPTQRVAAELRAEMARQNRSRMDLADALGISHSAASRRFDGSISLDVDELYRVAVWLSVPVSRFLGDALPTPRAAS